MAVLPLEIVVVLFAALLSRVLNKYPPFWERPLTGLRFWPGLNEFDVARFLSKSVAAARQFAKEGKLTSNTAQSAEAALDAGVRVVPPSYHPWAERIGWGWASMVKIEGANLAAVSIAYAGLAVAIAGGFELLSGRPNAYLDLVLLSSFGLVLASCVMALAWVARQTLTHSSLWLCWGAGLVSFIVSIVLLHAPEGFGSAYWGIPLRRAIADVAIVAPEAAALGAAADSFDGGAAAATSGAAPTSYLFGGDAVASPPNSALTGVTTTLSLIVAVAVALLVGPLARWAELYVAATRAGAVATRPAQGASATAVGAAGRPVGASLSFLRSALLHAGFVAPLAAWALLTAPAFGDGVALGVVPEDAASCGCTAAAPFSLDAGAAACASALRDCVPASSVAAAGSALVPIRSGLELLPEAPFARLVLSESAWLAVRALVILALAIVQLASVRTLAQAHLMGCRAAQTTLLVTGTRLALLNTEEREREKERERERSQTTTAAASGASAAAAVAASADAGAGAGSGAGRSAAGTAAAAAAGSAAGAGAGADADVPLPLGAVETLSKRLREMSLKSMLLSASTVLELITPPAIFALLAALLLRRGPGAGAGLAWLISTAVPGGNVLLERAGSLQASVIATISGGGRRSPTDAALESAIGISTGGAAGLAALVAPGGTLDPATTPIVRALHPAYAQLLLTYVLQFVAGAAVLVLIVTMLWHLAVAPHWNPDAKPAAAAATAPVAAPPAAAPAGGARKKNN